MTIHKQVRRRPIFSIATGVLAVVALTATSATLAASPALAATGPSAPTGLAATVSGTTVTLKWNPVAADGTDIYEDGTKIGWPGIPTGLRTAPTSYSASGVSVGNHRFSVSGYNRYGEGPQSTAVQISVTPPPVVGPLGPPTGLAAAVSGSAVTLNWNPVAGADGHDIYQDSVKIGWPGTPTGLAIAPKTFTVANVAWGTHSYAVSSYDSHGESARSGLVRIAVSPPAPPTTTIPPTTTPPTTTPPTTTPPTTTPPTTTPPTTTPPTTTPPTTTPPATLPGQAGGANAVRAGLGFYPGDSSEPGQMQLFKNASSTYGVSAKYVVLMGDVSSDSAFRDSTWGHFIQPGAWESYGPNRPNMVISVPLAFGGFNPGAAGSAANLQSVISGTHDDAYRYLASALVNAGYPNATIRLGWEFDGNWMPWEATHNPDLYVSAFRHVHDVMRSVAPSVQFDWNGATGQSFDGTRAYPGDAYVDVIGMDIYDSSATSVASLLNSREQFAVNHGKAFEIGEWALSSVYRGDDPAFIQGMYNWLAALPAIGGGHLLYQSYFLGDPLADGLGNKALFHFPNSRALYTQLFS